MQNPLFYSERWTIKQLKGTEAGMPNSEFILLLTPSGTIPNAVVICVVHIVVVVKGGVKDGVAITVVILVILVVDVAIFVILVVDVGIVILDILVILAILVIAIVADAEITSFKSAPSAALHAGNPLVRQGNMRVRRPRRLECVCGGRGLSDCRHQLLIRGWLWIWRAWRWQGMARPRARLRRTILWALRRDRGTAVQAIMRRNRGAIALNRAGRNRGFSATTARHSETWLIMEIWGL